MPWHLLQYKGAFNVFWVTCTEDIKDSVRPRLAQLQIKGNLAKFPVTEPLGDGLFEVRGRSKKVRVRFLFGFLPNQRIVIVWGGIKDQPKLPPAIIAAARIALAEAKASMEALNVTVYH